MQQVNNFGVDIALLGVFTAGILLGAVIAALLLNHLKTRAITAVKAELEQTFTQQLNEMQLQHAGVQHQFDAMTAARDELLDQCRQHQVQFEQTRGRAEELEKQLAVVEERLQQNLEIKAQLQRKESELSGLRNDNTEIKTRLEQEQKHFDQQFKLLNEAKSQLSKEFENLAHKIFDAKQQQFTEQSKSTLDNTLDPLRNQLSEFRKKVEDVYEKENAERNKLVGQIGELQKQTQQISADAINLANALKGDNKAQGNWGEVILERLLEESGLQKGREYETQVALKSESGQRRNPDVIVRLPDNKDIIIDAKVSLLDYERYCSTDDDQEREKALKQHIASLRGHIANLSIKDYEKLEGVRSLDFVFIFVPIEAAFMLALQYEPSLFREAYDKHIIVVSPTTLLATLRTVESIWRYEKQNKNAETIAKQAGGLYDQFVLMLEALDDVGRLLGKTQEAYDTAHKRLKTGRGNLIKRVEDIKKLGAKTKKTISPALVDEALDEERLAESPGEKPSLLESDEDSQVSNVESGIEEL